MGNNPPTTPRKQHMFTQAAMEPRLITVGECSPDPRRGVDTECAKNQRGEG